ncbi:hypothetical protein SLA2020_351330 [Shorea laevis]
MPLQNTEVSPAGNEGDQSRHHKKSGITTLDEAYTLVQDLSWSKAQFTRFIGTQNTTTKSRCSGSDSLRGPPPLKPNPNGAPPIKDDKGKGVASETSKLRPRVQCFRCQGFGLVTSNCANKALVINGQEYMSEEEGLEKQIYEPNLDEFKYLDDDCLGDPNYLSCVESPCVK